MKNNLLLQAITKFSLGLILVGDYYLYQQTHLIIGTLGF